MAFSYIFFHPAATTGIYRAALQMARLSFPFLYVAGAPKGGLLNEDRLVFLVVSAAENLKLRQDKFIFAVKGYDN